MVGKRYVNVYRLLTMATDGKSVRSQDIVAVFGFVAAFHPGSGLVWDFVRSNWATLKRRYRKYYNSHK